MRKTIAICLLVCQSAVLFAFAGRQDSIAALDTMYVALADTTTTGDAVPDSLHTAPIRPGATVLYGSRKPTAFTVQASQDTKQRTGRDTIKVAKDTLSMARAWQISLVLPSFGQYNNKQYWKMPIVLGGISGLAYAGFRSNMNYLQARSQWSLLPDDEANADQRLGMQSAMDRYKRNRSLFYIGAGAVYLWSVLDGVAFNTVDHRAHSPAKAAIYATMLPGLGQTYNKKYWKLPLVYGGFLTLGYFIQSNNFRYNFYRNAYYLRYEIDQLEKNKPEGWKDKVSALEQQIPLRVRSLPSDRLSTYKNLYRRDRDFFIIMTTLFYGLTIVDAVVDAHLSTFDVSNDLSFDITPYVEHYAYAQGFCAGINLSFKF